MVQIEIQSGPDTGKILDLRPGSFTFGRAKTNDQVLALDSVSGRHLELQINEAGEVRFKDLGSTNGTWAGGVQVQEGEWFPGSELRLGQCALRLLDATGGGGAPSATSAEDADDQDVHRRAREAAMSGKRKGGPLQLVLAVVLLLGAGGGAWWTFGRGAGEEENPRTGVAGTQGANVILDAIEGYGDFAEAEVWVLGKGVTMDSGSARNRSGRNLLKLNRNFPMDGGALQLSASVQGMSVRPLLSWGTGAEEDGATGTWEAGDLANGSTILPLPKDAAWFQLSLLLEGSGSLTGLQVDFADGAPQSAATPFGRLLSSGANLLISDNSAVLLSVRGQGGSWTNAEGGMRFEPTDNAELAVAASSHLLEAGSFLILGDGGPTGLARGVIVDDSPGLLLGGGPNRFMMRFENAVSVRSADNTAQFQATAPITLLWDLRTVLTDAARLSQEINRASRAGEDQALLSAVAALLREMPLDDEKIQEALVKSREAIDRGRSEFQALQGKASGALFVGAAPVMRDLQGQAEALAAGFPGTDMAADALLLAGDLSAAVADVEAEEAAMAAEYRERVQAALESTYPVLSHWIQREAN
ncbi:MAG: FHA domain-containing protein [Planctomycetota bacterium]|jgi:hypothetical protein